MVIFVVAHLHGLEGVSVIGVGQRQGHGALALALVHVVLESHFQCHLHGHAAGIGEEAVIQVAGQPVGQLVGEASDRLVGQPAQHHVGKFVRLVLDGLSQHRVLVAVDHAPPGGDGIDHFIVFCIQVNPVGVHNLVGVFHGFHLLIRIPDHNSFTSNKFSRTVSSIARLSSPSFTQAITGMPVMASHMARLSSSITFPGWK